LRGSNVKETSAGAKVSQPQSLTEQKWSRTCHEHIVKNEKEKQICPIRPILPPQSAMQVANAKIPSVAVCKNNNPPFFQKK
jgi:hypothetical protein